MTKPLGDISINILSVLKTAGVGLNVGQIEEKLDEKEVFLDRSIVSIYLSMMKKRNQVSSFLHPCTGCRRNLMNYSVTERGLMSLKESKREQI